MIYTQYKDAYSLPNNDILTSKVPVFGDYLIMQTNQYEYILVDYTANKVHKITRSNYNSNWTYRVIDDDNVVCNISVPTAVYGTYNNVDYVLYGGNQRILQNICYGVVIATVIFCLIWGIIKRCLSFAK